MKTYINLVLTTAFFLLISCAQNELQKTTVNAKKVEAAFYRPIFNESQNPENKIITHVNLLEQTEIEYIKDHILTNLLHTNFTKIEGVAIYYDNPNLSEAVRIKNENILGITVYEINSNGEMKHSFFKKNKDASFTKELSLLENFMSTLNQSFIVYRYFPEFYKIKPLGVSILRNIDFDREKIFKQRNEFIMRRVTDTYKNVKLYGSQMQRVREWELGFTEPGDCTSNCQETGIGECDSTLWCNVTPPNSDNEDPDKEDGDCDDEEQKSHAIQTGVAQTTADAVFDLSLHRDLRDNVMKSYTIGQKYISYYYAVSKFLRKNDYDLTTLYKIVTTLPEFNNAIQKLVDTSYNGKDIIITPELKSELRTIIASMRTFSGNEDYQYILSDFENDLEIISNKDKNTLINGLH